MHHKADRFAYPGAVLKGLLSQRGVFVCVLFGLVASVACSVESAGTPTEADLGITPTAVPTATAEPTSTPAPTPTPMALGFSELFDELDAPELAAEWELPIDHCEQVGEPGTSDGPDGGDESTASPFVPRGVSAIRCVDGDAVTAPEAIVQAVANARIVQIGDLALTPENAEILESIEGESDPSVAQWVDDGLLGTHIVLDIDLPAQAEVDPVPADDANPAATADTKGANREDPEAPPTTEADDADPEAPPTTEADDTDTDETDTKKTDDADPEPTTESDTDKSDTDKSDTDKSDTDKSDEADSKNTDESDAGTEPTGVASIQVVYGGMDADFRHLELGQRVGAGDILGTTDPDGTVLFGVWVNGVRQDKATAIATKAPSKNEQRRIANRLAQEILPPTDPECGLVKSQGRIPGAPREYRHGFHQGIDFVCTGDGNEVTSAADGTVVYLIDDYRDATVEDRNALLSRAIPAGNTPYWTLAMLYGNVVVIDHGDIDGIGRVFTISAHLDSVADNIELGDTVEQDQVIGIVGTTGTNASADGVPNEDDPGQHLHWELFIDNWYLGQDLTPPEVQEIIVAAVCEEGSPDCDSSD